MNQFAILTFAALLALPARAADESATEWKEEESKNGVVIHSRIRAGSGLKEFRAIGGIEAPPPSVFAVLDDAEAYPKFMPYTSECRVLKRAQDFLIAYQRLNFPLISDHDYTLRSEHMKWLGPDGPIYRIRWAPANDLGPAAKPGVQRVNVCEGGWLLEPSGPSATRATYVIYTDSGGAIPSFLAHKGSRIAIRKIFEAVRKQVRDPRYSQTN